MDYLHFDADLLAPLWAEYWFIAVVLVFALIAKPLFGRRRRWSGKRPSSPDAKGLYDPSEQMRAITNAGFERRRIMNQTEFAVFRAIDSVLPNSYRLMAQTSLGEVLGASKSGDRVADRRAHASINSKRLDIAVIDRSGFVALAIEVQGKGHYGAKNTFMRDAVKREALRRAGIPLLEVHPDWTTDRIQQQVTH
ncbi:hypothetical protein ROE7235_02899 [Roseibaca ekhonensis]|uniref:DUF2726 domain-containing protein n=1 Tax=Roseinatronobacter ekhonensis TaxID=254356 RepID=A0A3B0MB85_9RHOB|nr:DUF2726 domain-containing protein [Roseibaca ekhonensis]SUZ33131.1 hypothetical protein ROE7235_02899 [Roseibaca ekhonensis]